MGKGYDLIEKYYGDMPELKRILVEHSESVARKALACADAHPELAIDRDFLYEAAMLHDIGIYLTDAPSIECRGKLPYIAHGLAGWLIMETEGEPKLARVCARHTGAGLTAGEIRRQQLPLPAQDMLPETIEEKLVCYADKFFSKSGNLSEEKPIGKVKAQMAAFGEETLKRFLHLHTLFG